MFISERAVLFATICALTLLLGSSLPLWSLADENSNASASSSDDKPLSDVSTQLANIASKLPEGKIAADSELSAVKETLSELSQAFADLKSKLPPEGKVAEASTITTLNGTVSELSTKLDEIASKLPPEGKVDEASALSAVNKALTDLSTKLTDIESNLSADVNVATVNSTSSQPSEADVANNARNLGGEKQPDDMLGGFWNTTHTYTYTYTYALMVIVVLQFLWICWLLWQRSRQARISDLPESLRAITAEALEQKFQALQPALAATEDTNKAVTSLQKEFQQLKNSAQLAEAINKEEIEFVNAMSKQAAAALKKAPSEVNASNTAIDRALYNLLTTFSSQEMDVGQLQQLRSEIPSVLMNSHYLGGDYPVTLDYLQQLATRQKAQAALIEALGQASRNASSNASRKAREAAQQQHQQQQQALTRLQGDLDSANLRATQAEAKQKEVAAQQQQAKEDLQASATQLETANTKLQTSTQRHSRLEEALDDLLRSNGFARDNGDEQHSNDQKMFDAIKVFKTAPRFCNLTASLTKLKAELQRFQQQNSEHPLAAAACFADICATIEDNFFARWQQFEREAEAGRRDILVGHWNNSYHQIWRSTLIIESYWPEHSELIASFVDAKLSIQPVLQQYQITPHVLRCLCKPEDVLVTDKVVVDDNARMSEAIEESEVFKNKAKVMSSEYTIVCDIGFWGIDIEAAGNGRGGDNFQSRLICRGMEAE